MLGRLDPAPAWADAEFFLRRGDLRESLGDDAGAALDWRRALAADPAFAPARNRLEGR
jgi:hypothetical protein